MRRYIHLLLFFLAVLPLSALAQNRTITGSLYDAGDKSPISYGVVQLLKADSAYVAGTTTSDSGTFKIVAPNDGRYIVKTSYVGYPVVTRNVTIANASNVSLGRIGLSSSSHRLGEVTVIARAPKVVVKEDTFQYNASAYRVPEGSTIEALVKRLPGAEVADDGTITINGKTVKKILVDGKEFMTGDTKTAMKNIPTSIIEKVKAYDKQSDLARVTGIDDGEEETVLDFGLKKGRNRGFFSNVDLGIGTKSRYSERLMAAYFSSKLRMMTFGNANNVNDMGFGGRGRGFGGNRQGLNSSKMVGLNINYTNEKILQMDGSLRWNHSDGDLSTKRSAENFVAQAGSFSNALSQQYTRSNSWDGRFRLEWTPDTLWNIMFRPNFQVSTSDGRTISTSAAYNDDPYSYTTDPLTDAAIAQLKDAGIMVNRQQSTTITYGNNTQVGGRLQVNRKLGSRGRNVTLRVDGDYQDTDSKTFSTQDIEYFQLSDALGADSTYQAYRYNLMPVRSWDYSLRATYSEPIARRTYLQLSYRYSYSFSKSDRSTYDFSRLPSGTFGGVAPAYRAWDSYLSLLPDNLDGYYDSDLSRYSEYRTYTHDIRLMLRINQTKWRLNAGVMLQPQHSTYLQDYLGVRVDTARSVVNWSPTFDFRYKFNKQSNLRINYRGSATQPTMSQLLSIVDNTDPQNVSVGNPGLKPSFTNRFRLFFNNFRSSHMQSIMVFVNMQTTRNAIANSIYYDASTGARTVKPVNVNGNWGVNAALMFNTSIDSAGVWNLNTFTRGSFNRYASYLQMRQMTEMQKNITRSLNLGERLSMSYRNSWLEVELDGSADYVHTRNNLQAASNLSTWQFAYGANVNVTLPWGMSLSTDIHERSRRGYSDASLNTNELVWNAQLSQSFLKGNALTVSLQAFDILHNQSNLSRVINASSRTDTEYNSINSYLMLKASYRLNIFGGKSSGSHRGGPRDFDHHGPGMGPRPAGGPHGGRGPRGGGFGGPMM